MKKRCSWVYMVLLLVAAAGSAVGQGNLYGNNATGGVPYIYVMNPTTLAVTDTLTNLSGINGRGVVAVNGIIYYTSATTNSVYSYTLATHTNHGVLFSVAGARALSTIAFDGTNFWIGDYSGTNQAYLYSKTGTLLKTIHLANCLGSCDGLEYFLQGGTTPRLIENRGDAVGPYDVYDTNGTLITASFITPSFASTGIAYDGTNFVVSDLSGGRIAKLNGTTGALISTTAITGFPGGFTPLVEDLSFDYAVTLPGGIPTTPAPSGLLLTLTALLGLTVWFYVRRRRQARA
jgi:hypothetical protein